MSLIKIETGYDNPLLKEEDAQKVVDALLEVGPGRQIRCPLTACDCSERCPCIGEPRIVSGKAVGERAEKLGVESGTPCHHVNTWYCNNPMFFHTD